jgi:hypothetical protein
MALVWSECQSGAQSRSPRTDVKEGPLRFSCFLMGAPEGDAWAQPAGPVRSMRRGHVVVRAQTGPRETPGANSPMSAVVRSSARALFADLIRQATVELDAALSPMAVAYLVELLEARVSCPAPEDPTSDQSLGHALLLARGEAGRARVALLRAVGDRSLFEAGFFADSLWRRGLSDGYYEQIGCEAYHSLSSCLARDSADSCWPALFGELAESFPSLVELLGEVGDQTRGSDCGDLLRIYSRYLETGSRRDRARLLRRGIVPVSGERWKEPQ